jgi:ribonuclease R
MQSPSESFPHFRQLLPAVCAQASRTEREAEALEREVAQLKKVQFMQGYEGEVFTGIVSGITPWGVYVMLPSTVEGMVPAEAIKKSGLRYDKDRRCFVSKRNRPAFSAGTEVTVRLVSCDVEERRIVFKVVSTGCLSR